MSGVRGRNTRPELRVRKALFASGFRFRLHKKGLPGTPDIVLAKYRLAIFVHGCFWHQHPGCRYATVPKSNQQFWLEKLERNKIRDKSKVAQLLRLKWRVLLVWECATRGKIGEELEELLADHVPSDICFAAIGGSARARSKKVFGRNRPLTAIE